MENPTSHQPLTDAELDRLAEFLNSVGNPALNIEFLDGYFAALICGPDVVFPSEYLPNLWGEGVAFESDEQVAEITHLLTRHWSTISSELQRTLQEPDVYLPILLEREDGVAPANDWAHGFMQAVHMRWNSWKELIDDEENGGSMVPIMMLHHEHDPDPQMRPPEITSEKREKVLETMIAGLTHIYRYFEPHRRASAGMALRRSFQREAQKIGRNEACPCGSGKKFKHCCLEKSPTLH
ncbi:UPF0149 family protein [Paraburkholderia phenoliruptrix]|uniref:UPF0149 family protein n=1 Tax=Paraburkholderia phenoliruptrix TaxID=252970 RepID=UPI002869E3E9|nr:UPF0149 family protein [Paraburkholderia phenoliruptrix]WMY11080.1 UPF0149 family protein [Paraburkholderia phenoliruptrix]